MVSSLVSYTRERLLDNSASEYVCVFTHVCIRGQMVAGPMNELDLPAVVGLSFGLLPPLRAHHRHQRAQTHTLLLCPSLFFILAVAFVRFCCRTPARSACLSLSLTSLATTTAAAIFASASLHRAASIFVYHLPVSLPALLCFSPVRIHNFVGVFVGFFFDFLSLWSQLVFILFGDFRWSQSFVIFLPLTLRIPPFSASSDAIVIQQNPTTHTQAGDNFPSSS